MSTMVLDCSKRLNPAPRSVIVLLLSRGDVERAFAPGAALEAARDAFASLARGEVELPPQALFTGGAGPTGVKSARSGSLVATKVVSLRTANPARGLPATPATILVLDDATGTPRALLDGTAITSMRTAAASALASTFLAVEDARTLAILGAGAQAVAHLALLPHALPSLTDVRVWSPRSAAAFAMAHPGVHAVGSPREALHDADVVCCCTSAREAILDGRDLSARAHVNAVGSFRPTTRELDDETVRRATRLIVDQREAALREAGDLILAKQAGVASVDPEELGDLVVGRRPRRRVEDGVTVFKSVGLAVQDAAAAAHVLAEAQRLGLGTPVQLDR